MTTQMAKSEAEVLDRVLNRPPPRATWYRPDGLPIPNLPADPYHQVLYSRKGWSMTPPANPVKVDAAKAAPSPTPLPGPVELAGAPPPRHMHVFQPELGSPCLVRGCLAVRQNPKGSTFKGRKG